jgi:acyl transferase domain-containing protein/thioesterase domain-containing protein
MPNDDLIQETNSFEQIAVIGMAGSFPGSNTLDEFWSNLCQGKDGFLNFSDDELKRVGIPEEWLRDPNFVKVGTRLDHFDEFDARFFGYSGREASLTDPQQRLFIEKSWEALEHAGYTSDCAGVSIGVYAGASSNSFRELLPRLDIQRDVLGRMELMIGNELDYVATRVSYKLNLKGPSVTIQTACSTSLTAVHFACQGLLTYQCSLALAGGVSVNIRRPWGYFYKEGGILSPDGRCRAFDADANGTVIGQGVGVVVLKRFSEALADGDTIYAVIKGSAINNDGSSKIGFTAPSVDGQAEVISLAHGLSDIKADSITYVEAHGTGTKLGDPIEVAALTKAFRATTNKSGYCALGSVKTNIGHADTAAGIAGLIKTVLMLKNGKIPPSLYYQTPNPEIDFSNSPFFVPTRLGTWSRNSYPRRAGVSSFGLGGTNVHMVLEEAPDVLPSDPSRSHQLIMISAKTQSALTSATGNLARYLEKSKLISLSDAAYTLKVGRKHFEHRRAFVCNSREDAVSILKDPSSSRSFIGQHKSGEPSMVFMFTGQGSQYPGMARELYETEPIFRGVLDSCAEILTPILELDLRRIIYAGEDRAEDCATRINQTAIAQPALFILEYALAKLWESWGIRPRAMVGHSIGEYVAACLAGVFDLESALALVAARGRLMQEMPPGAMLAVAASETVAERLLSDKLALAAVNAPGSCVVSGDFSDIEAFEEQLDREKIVHKRLVTSHAFHSHMMAPAAQLFAGEIDRYKLYPPCIPFLSNRSGTWITDEQATNPHYWGDHLRQTVRFSQCIETLLKGENQVFLEVGPGNTLSMLVKQQSVRSAGLVILTSLRHPKEDRSDAEHILTTLGRLWLSGVNPDWAGFYASERRRRIPLPNYPFERQRFWPDLKELDQQRQYDQQKQYIVCSPVSGGETTNDSNFIESAETRLEVKKDSRFASEAEISVAKIWRELLHMPDIGPTDNYFELGGSSLLAARLFDQIEKRFKKRLPLATLYEAPTIRELAARIVDKNFAPSWSSLVEINKGNSSRQPLFLMHSEGGNVLEYWALSRYLGEDQPIYAMQAKWLEGEAPIRMTIEEIAKHFISEMRTVQKTGPYYLGGYCLGGLVAYEMAKQLIDGKETVNFLSLISSRTPQSIRQTRLAFSKPKRIIGKIGERVGLELNNLSYLNWAEKGNYVCERFSQLVHMTKMRCEKLADQIFSLTGHEMHWHSRDYILQTSVDHTNSAFFEYQPQPIEIDVFLFWVKKYPYFYADNETLGWSDLVKGKIHSFGIDCFHKNIMKEPHIRPVGERLNELLREAQKLIPN